MAEWQANCHKQKDADLPSFTWNGTGRLSHPMQGPKTLILNVAFGDVILPEGHLPEAVHICKRLGRLCH